MIMEKSLSAIASRAGRRAMGISDMRSDLTNLKEGIRSGCRESQLLFILAYQQRKLSGQLLPEVNDVEFRVFSQNGEDGISWYIFSLIGAETKTVVEIFAGDGIQCNAANLLVNHGWTALLVDGDEGNVTRGRAFYQRHPDTFGFAPRFLHAWVDADNVNRLVTGEDFEGEIDLLSLDIDGIDYWLWRALTAVRPRVVVAEVQAIWSDSRAVTVPYCSDFRTECVDGFGIYCGASLPAFVKLARAKGYRLVGTQRHGYNAFFCAMTWGRTVFRKSAHRSGRGFHSLSGRTKRCSRSSKTKRGSKYENHQATRNIWSLNEFLLDEQGVDNDR